MTIEKFISEYNNYAKKYCKEIVEKYKHKLETEDVYQDIMLILCELYQTHKNKNKIYIIKCINSRLSNYINRVWLKNPLSNAESYEELYRQ